MRREEDKTRKGRKEGRKLYSTEFLPARGFLRPAHRTSASAMARLLPPLLMLCSALKVAALYNQRGCADYPEFKPATQVFPCPSPPCNTTEETVILALPVVLSLGHPHKAWEADKAWGMTIELLQGTSVNRGEVRLIWNEEQSEVVLRGTTCGDQAIEGKIFATHQPEYSWLHLQVELAGRNITLYHQNATRKVVTLTLPFRDDPPTLVAVQPRTRLGYSAINTVDTQASNTAADHAAIPTANNNNQPLTVVITVLVAISVVVSVAMLVLVW